MGKCAPFRSYCATTSDSSSRESVSSCQFLPLTMRRQKQRDSISTMRWEHNSRQLITPPADQVLRRCEASCITRTRGDASRSGSFEKFRRRIPDSRGRWRTLLGLALVLGRVFFRRRDRVLARKPPVQIHVRTAFRAEWPVLFILRLAAHRAFARLSQRLRHRILRAHSNRVPHSAREERHGGPMRHRLPRHDPRASAQRPARRARQ